MKRHLLASLFVALPLAAHAADLSSANYNFVSAPASAQSYNWTGAYIGGHAGWAWDQAELTDQYNNAGFWGTLGDSTTIDSDGFIGGGQIGYWYQPSNLVFGVDVSGSWADLGGSTASPRYPTTDTWSTQIDWFLLAQARVGFAMGKWLVFAQGGYAGAQASASGFSLVGARSVSDDQWHNGWTVGAGVAVKANRWLSFGVEYNYVDLGSQTYNWGTPTPGETLSVDHQFSVVKGTINVHFNGN